MRCRCGFGVVTLAEGSFLKFHSFLHAPDYLQVSEDSHARFNRLLRSSSSSNSSSCNFRRSCSSLSRIESSVLILLLISTISLLIRLCTTLEKSACEAEKTYPSNMKIFLVK